MGQAGAQGIKNRVSAVQTKSASSATLESIPEVRTGASGAIRRSQTLGRPLPPLKEPLLPEMHPVGFHGHAWAMQVAFTRRFKDCSGDHSSSGRTFCCLRAHKHSATLRCFQAGLQNCSVCLEGG